MAVGNELGKVNVYDLRNPNPLYTINHSYKLPIKKIKFHEHSQNIITVDKKLAKFSNSKNGKVFTNIETKHDINDFEFYHNTGMFFVNIFYFSLNHNILKEKIKQINSLITKILFFKFFLQILIYFIIFKITK